MHDCGCKGMPWLSEDVFVRGFAGSIVDGHYISGIELVSAHSSSFGEFVVARLAAVENVVRRICSKVLSFILVFE